MKKILSLLLGVLLLAGCSSNVGTSKVSNNKQSQKISFTDDSGKKIILNKPAQKIISLYSANTENLYSLGLDKEIIGVGMSDKYPEKVLKKKRYSSKDDPELVIAAKPDVVLARTFDINQYPKYFKAIESAGIPVVDLYCDSFDKFDEYITKLGTMVGRENEAKNLISQFNSGIKKIKNNSEKIKNKKTAYFESVGKGFETATPNSFAGTALTLVGLDNIVKDAKTDSSKTVFKYGEESLLSKADNIDVYIAQKGAMNKTVSVEEIKNRPGYSKIKAVQKGNIIIIDEQLISSATLRYLDGLKELQDKVYGDQIH